MNIKEIRQKVLYSPEYEFLKTNSHLGTNIILLGLGGSHAYGTNIVTSDLDVRGCALNTKEEVLLGRGFEQVQNNDTDTVIYSFNKLVSLLTNCNPNTIEILGLRPEHYIYKTDIGQELLNNKNIFLSRKAAFSFGGYATAQFRRLDNKSARLLGQAQKEKHILNSINNAKITFNERYFPLNDNDYVNLYLDDAVNEEYDLEIFMDAHISHYPLRDYKCMWSEMHNIVKDYAKIGKRNKHAIEHDKLGKHMCHLYRLYLMCIDILKSGEIITYREKEHDLLMSIRNGEWLDNNRQPIPDFFKLIDDIEKKYDYWKVHTKLPDKPDYKSINNFIINVNERIIKGDIQ